MNPPIQTHRLRRALAPAAMALSACLVFCACAGNGAVSLAQSESAPSAAPQSVAQPMRPPTPTPPWIYYLPLDEFTGVVVDQDGNEVLRGAYLTILYDVFTGHPQAIEQRIPLEETPPGDWQTPLIFTDCDSILYATDGTVLRMREPGIHRGGFGQYVVYASSETLRYDFSPSPKQSSNFSSALIDSTNGDVVLEDAHFIDPFGTGRWLVSDGSRRVMGVVDDAFNKLVGFPMEEEYYGIFEWGEQYIADIVEADGVTSTGCVLDENFEILHTYPGATFSQDTGLGGGALLIPHWPEDPAQKPTSQLLNGATGEPVAGFSAVDATGIVYYDGALLVINQWTNTGRTCRLETVDGRIVADGFSFLTPAGEAFTLYAQQFYGIRDGEVVLIDRSGTVQATAPGSYTSIWNFGPSDGLLRLESWDASGAGQVDAALYDSALGERIPPGKYAWFHPLQGFATPPKRGETTYLSASRKEDFFMHGAERSDIMDSNGTLILEDLERVHYDYSYGTRFVVENNGVTGLMDTAGQWLWRSDA